ncbi:DUF4864 domain-containing protein [Falsihalocynthiibacter sp. SS001]|uniref:DUF4864 domain-containing protein n=1 Tax=Falsihalocynthiibacter sp. SS001 TaxID=3349698 RepID=UPI0036D25919
MRNLLVGALCLALSPLAAVAQTGDKDGPVGALENTVLSQIEAFRAGDFEAAFEFSSDGIRKYFGSHETFKAMVSNGYSMVVDPEEVTFLNNRPEGRAVWLKVLIRSKNGEAHVLDYQMVPDREGWKINAVLPATEGRTAA